MSVQTQIGAVGVAVMVLIVTVVTFCGKLLLVRANAPEWLREVVAPGLLVSSAIYGERFVVRWVEKRRGKQPPSGVR